MAKRSKKNTKPTSIILYEGPSMLDGSPIVCIATGLNTNSSNGKTGAMIQTWILRADMTPMEASRTGADVAICGDCPLKGIAAPEKKTGVAKKRPCYVLLQNAPLSVYKTYKKGRYTMPTLTEAAAMIDGEALRMGSYGDPAAVPFYVWQAICPGASTITGYSHSWRKAPELAAWVMASVETLADQVSAKIMGFRTFRVRSSADAPMAKREVVCPASEEAGRKLTCIDCKACGGTSSKARADMVIATHGGGSSAFRQLAA
jgi:hypothetical protein